MSGDVTDLIIFLLAVLLAAQTVRLWFWRKALLAQRKQHELMLKIKDGTIRVLTDDVSHLQKRETSFTLAAQKLGPDEWPDVLS